MDWAADPPQILKDDRPFAELGEFIHAGGGYDDVPGVPGCPVAPQGGSVWLLFSRMTPPDQE